MKTICITTAFTFFTFVGISQYETSSTGFAPGGCYQDPSESAFGNRFNLTALNSFDGKMTVGLSSLNFASLGVSTVFMVNQNRSNAPYIIGMSTGLMQTGYGIFQNIQLKRYNCEPIYYGCGDYLMTSYDPFELRRSRVNMGIGAVTTLVNTFGLFRNMRLKKNADLNWNVYGSQEKEGGISLGFNVIKRF